MVLLRLISALGETVANARYKRRGHQEPIPALQHSHLVQVGSPRILCGSRTNNEMRAANLALDLSRICPDTGVGNTSVFRHGRTPWELLTPQTSTPLYITQTIMQCWYCSPIYHATICVNLACTIYHIRRSGANNILRHSLSPAAHKNMVSQRLNNPH